MNYKQNNKIKIFLCVFLTALLFFQFALLFGFKSSAQKAKKDYDIISGKLATLTDEINTLKNEVAKLDKN